MSRMFFFFMMFSLAASAQASSNTAPNAANKPSAAAKPSGRARTAAKNDTAAQNLADVEPMPSVDKPTAIIDTTAGRMKCTLIPDQAPKAVDNFVGLATGVKDWKNLKTKKTMHHVRLYDGTIFHRVIPNFMIQGGDPLGNSTGGPGYEIDDEFPNVKFDGPGRLAYANSGRNTSGSQFFITEAATPWLDGPAHYTIFGICDESTVTLVKNISRRARDERNDRPFDPVKIEKITILGMTAKPSTSNAPSRKKTPVKK